MTPADTADAVACAASALGALGLAGVLWSRREHTSLIRSVIVAALGLAVWSAGFLIVALGAPLDTPFLLGTVLAAVAVTVVGFHSLCRAVADRDWRTTPKLRVLLAVHPVLMLVAGLSNPLHQGLLRPAPAGGLELGWLFWVHTAVSYALVLGGLGVVVQARRTLPGLRREQATTLLLGSVLPLLGNALTLVVIGADGRDLTPMLALVTLLLVAYVTARRGYLEVVPVARARVFERLEDGVVVLDEGQRVADLNAAARRLLGMAGVSAEGLLGRRAEDALGPLAPAILGPDGHAESELDGQPTVLDVRSTNLTARGGKVIGRVVTVRDVTEEVRRGFLLAEANVTLLAQVETIERLRAEVAEQAMRDAVTGLLNRRALDAVLPERLADVERTGVPLSLVVVDVDHFKAVNDEHGHAAGDRLLAAVAAQLAGGIGERDSVVRYGGEEFVILMPDTGPDEAMLRAEELRERCGQASLEVRGGTVAVTVSAGVATTRPGRTTPDALFQAADAALYEAKRQGRDRTRAAA